MNAFSFWRKPQSTNTNPTMLKSILILTLLTAMSALAFSQKGSAFPELTTEDLKENTVTLPDAFGSRFALIGLATTKKAEEELRTWQKPVYNKFVTKTGMMDEMFDVAVYFVPVFTGASKAAKGKVVKQLKKNNESLVSDHLLIYSGDKSSLSVLNLDEKKSPYFFLTDPSGTIVWMTEGPFRQKHLEAIEVILSGSE